MSRIKPHGPVSPHFMNHYYGAAKPAPASDDTALLRQALEALELCIPLGSDVTASLELTKAALRERLGEKS